MPDRDEFRCHADLRYNLYSWYQVLMDCKWGGGRDHVSYYPVHRAPDSGLYDQFL